MPINNPAPDFALLSGFNARSWSGVNVFDRGSDNISLPSYDSSSGTPALALVTVGLLS